MKALRILLLCTISLVLAGTSFMYIKAPTADALSGGDWQAGKIVDDSVFYNSNAMSEYQIQLFLNSKVPTCDNQGSQIYSGSTTRRAYSESKGISMPLTCLKDYFENPTTHENNLNGGSLPVGSKSAARLIWEVSQQFSINPQVLIVLLQKEQGLILDDWPWPTQYRSATGYGCPDTAPCDSQYYGFYNQIFNAAKQFQRYASSPNLFNFSTGSNTIGYNPNAGCGGSNVQIQNQATASLYNYTPYQPNTAALSNLYGTGDGCSAYGNRNFWRIFNDWFGSSAGDPISGPVYRMHNPYTGDWLLTLSVVEREAAARIGGYVLDDGTAFTGYASATPGAVPVYRLVRNGIHLYTSDPTELQVANTQVGYTNEGIRFYVKPSSETGNRPVYRLSNNSRYFYTMNAFERDDMVSRGFTYEGIPFYATSDSTKIPVYRVSRNGQHLYTTSSQERDGATTVGYRYDGIVFSAQSAVTSDAMPVYRVSRNGLYLLTTNRGERDAAVLLYGYQSEGTAFYGYPANYASTTPINRLAHNGPEDHMYITSPTEVSNTVSSGGYIFESVGFNE